MGGSEVKLQRDGSGPETGIKRKSNKQPARRLEKGMGGTRKTPEKRDRGGTMTWLQVRE